MLIYVLFFSIFILGFLGQNIGAVPRAVAYFPEILSALAIAVCSVGLIKRKVLDISPAYLLLFIFLFLVLLASTVANSVQAGAIFAGIRTYAKYIPFFFLPIIFQVTQEQLSMQLKALLFLILLQVPVSMFQRFVQFSDLGTGDVVVGTFSEGHVLTIMSMAAIAVLLAAYYKKVINQKQTVISVALLLIPPTINETTITLIFLPLVFIIPTLFHIRHAEEKGRLIAMMIIGSFALITFIGIYNVMYGSRWDGDIMNVVTDKRVFMADVVQEEFDEHGKRREVGRLDSITNALDYLSEYPTKLLMGVGIGNAGRSFSKLLVGEYNQEYQLKGGDITTVSHMLWETGVIGLILVLTFIFMIFLDAYALTERKDIYGVLALGWVAVSVMITISMIYKYLIPDNVLGYLFWYFSGIIIAENFRRKKTMMAGLRNHNLVGQES